MPSAEAVRDIWMLSLAAYALVVAVVAVMLTLILRTARQIHAGAAAIWTVGQQVANHTIHIALLAQTNHLARQILGRAGRLVEAVGAVERHAETCPRCPTCVTARKGA